MNHHVASQDARQACVLSIARGAMSPSWDAARSDRVFEKAVRARHARVRRQRWTMIAATAAVFVLAAHSFASANLRPTSIPPAASTPFTSESTEDDLGAQRAGAVAMSRDAFADGGRETD